MAKITFKGFGLPAGCAAFVLIMLLMPDGTMRPVLAIAAWMLIWWITEAVPIAVTALLPLVLFPLTGSVDIDTVARAYGSKYVFLFMGGFLIALAMEKWMLHKRIALLLISRIGTRPRRLVLGFMLSSALLSMWISNTATTLMMLPIAMSVIGLFPEDSPERHRFTLNLLLGIAYAANCGGIATLVGTPPNVAMAGLVSETFGIHVSFSTWMVLGLPFSIILLALVYLLLTRVLIRIGKGDAAALSAHLEREQAALGSISPQERRVLMVFTLTAVLWMTKDLLNTLHPVFQLNDSTISMLGGLALFIVGAHRKKPLLMWSDTARLPWGILLLFGGGMALANALKQSGLIDLIAGYFAGSEGVGVLTLTVALVVISLLLTELISNLALVLVFVPVVGAVAQGMGLDPLHFAVPVTLAASCAFMLPMATPPNAIVFAGGQIRIAEMMRTGVVLNVVAALLAVVFCSLVLPWWLELV